MSWRDAFTAALWVAALGLLLALPFVAYASCIAPTEAEKALCRPDATHLCAPQIKSGVFAILYCLKANRTQLSRGCAELLQECGQ